MVRAAEEQEEEAALIVSEPVAEGGTLTPSDYCDLSPQPGTKSRSPLQGGSTQRKGADKLRSSGLFA